MARQEINHSTPWHDPGDAARLQRIMAEFERGFRFLRGFEHDRVITVWGSARIDERHNSYKQARELGNIAANEGFTIVTGGGPGIMEAANRGAFDIGGRSAGLCIELPAEAAFEPKNRYMQEWESFYYFFVRKVMLAHVAQAYVYFPGGFGTLDEFFEISNLVITHKLHQQIPIILVNNQYWSSLKNWLDRELTDKFHTLYDQELEIWTVVDSPEEAMDLLRDIPRRVARPDSI